MQMAGGNHVVETTITIPTNSVVRTRGVREFIQAQFPDIDILLEFSIIDTPNTANQFVKYEYETNTFNVVSQRLSNNVPTAVIWDSPDYSANLVAGTQYNVKYIKGILS